MKIFLNSYKDILDQMCANSNGRFKVNYTLDYPPKGWTGSKGYITAEMIKGWAPPPEKEPMVLMCGPPPMIQNACKANLDALGYKKMFQVQV